MTLSDEGCRFYCAPTGIDCKWMQPVYRDHALPEWVDMTDAPNEELVAFLMSAHANEAA